MSQPNELITELYLRMYDFLVDYAKASLGNLSLAEEAVQETFVIAWQKQDAISSSLKPEGWLVNTLKNVISNMRKNQESGKRLLREYIAACCHDISIKEDSARIEILYEDIAETEEMKLIKEMAFEGCSYLEMAERRGISVPACRKRVQRAREVLRKKILE